MGGAPKGSYPGGWYAARRKALKRTGGLCERCGAPANDVHHKTPVRLFETWKEAHDQANLMPLCCACHDAVHREARAAIKPHRTRSNKGPTGLAASSGVIA